MKKYYLIMKDKTPVFVETRKANAESYCKATNKMLDGMYKTKEYRPVYSIKEITSLGDTER